MPAGTTNHQIAVKCVVRSLWLAFTFCGFSVHGLKGDGCGHKKLGPESGTLTSASYPGTYPQDVSCTWRLRVPQGRTLRLLLGDFDIEGSMDCTNGSLVITPSHGSPSIGPLCGRLTASEMKMSVSSNEASVIFRSGRHRSGRGFLLSYTTDQNPELISCKTIGTHLSSDQLGVYCPAGCKDVPGEVKGNSEQGYRDTSLICVSAVHGGVVSDSLGGRVNLTWGRGLRFYQPTFANGVLSKTGPLSEHKLLFNKECNGHLNMSLVNSSSLWGRAGGQGKGLNPAGPLVTWTAEPDEQNPWVELDLGEKRKVTGIITTGSRRFYIESYTLLFRKDRKDWKPYKGELSKEEKVFEAYSDGYLRVLNSLFPPVVARFVQLKPITWEKRASAEIQLLGCPVVKDTSKTFSSTADNPTDAPMVSVTALMTPPNTVNPGHTVTVEHTNNPTDAPVVSVTALTTPSSTVNPGHTVTVKQPTSDQTALVVVGVVLGLVLCASCLLAGFWLKRRKKDAQMKKYSTAKGPVDHQSLQRKSPGSESELISYPLENLQALNPAESRDQDTLPGPPPNDYAQPAAGGQALSSTFRPGQNPGLTAAFSFSRNHGPATLPEYATPLPPEPEYATPFSEQLPEARDPARPKGAPGRDNRLRTTLPPPPPPPPTGGEASPDHTHYDCPSHRLLSNGYCTPSNQGAAPRPSSAVYSEPEQPYSLLQAQPTYEELL
ncbi:unnamed protein product [Gadus morhua 'NCC']